MSEEATLDEFAAASDVEDRPAGQPESRFWGTIPEDWELVNGSDVYDVNPNPKPDEEPNTYIEMDALDTELPWPRYFGERDASEYSGKTFSAGDTLFARITPCTENGKAALVPEMETNVGIGSTEFAVLSPKRSSVNPWFLYHLGKSHPIHNYAVSRMRGSTGRQRVPFSVFRQELDVALPSVEEQRKIATVLYTIDQAIQKTEEIIEETKTAKKGAAQELFRSGLYEHEAKSRRLLGEVPKEWDIVTIGEICEKVTDGTHRAVPAQETGKPCLTAKNIRDWGFDLDDIKYISEYEHKEVISRCYPEKGDLLYVKDGANTGMVQVNTLDFEFSLLNSVILMKVDEGRIDPRFLEQMLSWEKMKKLIVARRTGTGIRRVTITNMEKSEVLVPCLNEQREIAEILASFDEQVARETELRRQFKRLKQGLMQDLLSGAVRTHETDIDIPEAVLAHG